ncbi:MAG: spore coat protein [Ruminococcus sp.]|nr:spore coat protein [Ruminococcus sp.]
MDDKQLMENLLLLEKGACDLMLHGTVESASPNVHRAFSTSLNASLQMQEQIYDKMQEKGWYPSQQVERQKIEQVKQKFSC